MQDIFKGFPNLHPMFVHFPIVLLLLATVAQLLVVVYPKNSTYKHISLFLIAFGCLGAFIAIKNAAHISGDADDKAIDIFKIHQRFGQITLYLSLFATILRLVFFKAMAKKWMEYILLILFFLISIVVSYTGHLGASMVYKYGVGPQGNGLLPK